MVRVATRHFGRLRQHTWTWLSDSGTPGNRWRPYKQARQRQSEICPSDSASEFAGEREKVTTMKP